MIKNLIFDFGKVLVDYDFEQFFRKYIPDTKRCAKFCSLLCNEEVQQLLDREAQPFEVIMEELIERNRDFEPEIRTFHAHYLEIVTQEMEGMHNLLTQLKAEGYKLYGLTNWCSKVRLTMAQFPIFQLLDGQVISSEEKIIKPEPGIYQRLFDKFNLKPEECLFTDDRLENIEGGQQMGMDGIVFENAQQYERELREKIHRAGLHTKEETQGAALHTSEPIQDAVLHTKTFQELTTDELYELLRIRSEVFVVEQNCVYQDLDGDDQHSLHLWLTVAGKVVALARICPAGTHLKEISIGRVITTERGKGYGKQIMLHALKAAVQHFQATRIAIEAQEYAKGFYEGVGFKQSSEPFMLDGIPHIQMIWEEKEAKR